MEEAKRPILNRLALHHKLHTLQLVEGESIQYHIRAITELFNELIAVGDVISQKDHAVYLFASLPESFGALVTALKANEMYQKWKL